ncbi:hypothetical protein [Litorimonas sp. WD9-15]|uniref:hypothetical protein n=1 Tax=Litorimonas sp. WD9-15 TaxID=3418716 RepID=UPI003D04785B
MRLVNRSYSRSVLLIIASIISMQVSGCGDDAFAEDYDSIALRQCMIDLKAKSDIEYEDVKRFEACLVSEGFRKVVSDDFAAECAFLSEYLTVGSVLSYALPGLDDDFEAFSEASDKFDFYNDVWAGVYSARVDEGGKALLNDEEFVNSTIEALGLNPYGYDPFAYTEDVAPDVMKEFKKCEKINLAVQAAAEKEFASNGDY